MYWDQYHGHCLTFIQPFPHTKQVHYDHSIFGFPLPHRTYLMKEGSRGFSYMPKSNWAYLDPHPKSKDQLGSQPSLKECQPYDVLKSLPLASGPSTATKGTSRSCSTEVQFPERMGSVKVPVIEVFTLPPPIRADSTRTLGQSSDSPRTLLRLFWLRVLPNWTASPS